VTARHWALVFLGERPPTLNAERRQHPLARARTVRRYREAFAALALEQRVPQLGRVRVRCWAILRTRRSVPDVGAHIVAAKAAVDGLVDAGVLADDGPEQVVELAFVAPVFGGPEDGFVVVVEEVAS